MRRSLKQLQREFRFSVDGNWIVFKYPKTNQPAFQVRIDDLYDADGFLFRNNLD